MNIKNETSLKPVVNSSDELLGTTHNPDKDDEREDAELSLLVEARKKQEEIEVDINAL